MKDKTFHIEHNGQLIRVRARKKPNKETVEALKAMVDAILKKPTLPA